MNNILINSENNKKRGRPAKNEPNKKRFNLNIKYSTLYALNKIAAQKQLNTGVHVSTTQLINSILDNYIAN